MTRAVMTVLGPIEPAALGVTLTHEHVLFEQRPKLPLAVPHPLADEPLAMRHLGLLRREPSALTANWSVQDVDLAAAEVGEFRASGGGTIVDVSCRGLARDAAGLRTVALKTGVNLITVCGYYTGHFHPPDLIQRSVDDVAAEFVHELTVGIGDTGVRAGVIGEIGTGEPMYSPGWQSGMADLSPSEELVVRAAGRAQREVGAPVSIHIFNYVPNRLAHHVLDLLEAEGADLQKVVIDHLDTRPDPDYAQSIADRGAFIEFDTFGIEFVSDATFTQFARDSQRIELVVEMIRRGYLDHILLSHDVCWKSLLVRYGGYGYAHLSQHVEPWLRHAGISDAQIAAMRVVNPARWLTYDL
jgi:phosphotriesterase-related protein